MKTINPIGLVRVAIPMARPANKSWNLDPVRKYPTNNTNETTSKNVKRDSLIIVRDHKTMFGLIAISHAAMRPAEGYPIFVNIHKISKLKIEVRSSCTRITPSR